jgi:hypothetical protein
MDTSFNEFFVFRESRDTCAPHAEASFSIITGDDLRALSSGRRSSVAKSSSGPWPVSPRPFKAL